MVQEAASHAEEDRKQKELAEAKNQSDALVYQTERMLKDLGDKVPADEKLRIETAIQNVKNAVASNEAADIKRTMEELQQASYKLSEILYKQSSPQGQTEGGPEPPPSQPTDTESDDVIDADFNQ
jgi:molecular chaperone DnaK